ncbi:MAG: type II toxin-antitoxin system VapC family toxin [Gammaproteobacteria bacterium]
MKFWDTSAIVPLLADEPGRLSLLASVEADPVMFVWWGTPVECMSAVARREREGTMSIVAATSAAERLRKLSHAWHEVLPGEQLRGLAQRLLRVHPLRAADSLQLAAAILAAEHDPARLVFVCLDTRLAQAASREGFDVRGAE